MGVDFYNVAVDLLGVLPSGFDFVYVILAIVLAICTLYVFIILPIAFLFKIGGY